MENENIGILNVIQSSYINCEQRTFDELFDDEKFDTLHAITYSSTFDVVYELASKFNHTEIIFGYGKVLNGKISAALASQKESVTLMKKSKHFDELIQMIRDGKLELYLLKGRVSHEKLYCLSGENNAFRVITGSANMSRPALNGNQAECIIEYNEEAAYNAFMRQFLRDKMDSTTELDPELINTTSMDDSSVQETPIFGVIEKEKEVYIPVPVNASDTDYDEFQFISNVNDIIKDETTVFDEMIRLPSINNDKRRYRNDALQKALMTLALREEADEKVKKEFIQFQVNKETGQATFNGADFDKFVIDNFSKQTIKSDIDGLAAYMESFEIFRGDVYGMKDVMWRLLCYSFASPFICELRRTAIKCGYTGSLFPMYVLVCGRSDSSKTVMTRVIGRLMSGKDVTNYDSDTFTKTTLLKGLKAHQIGLPIFINDLTGDQWTNHAGKILKQDNFEIKNPKYDCPATIITTNDVKSLKEEESKRCVLLRTTAILDKSVALSEGKHITDLLDSLSPHFYMEYLRRMSEQTTIMKNRMLNGDSDYTPDLMSLSSNVIIDICKDECGFVYDFMKPLSLNEDYLGDSSVGRDKVRELIDYWETQPDMFTFKRNGKVVVRFDKSYVAERYKNELPRNICYDSNNMVIICDEDALHDIGIKKPLFRKRS